MGKCGYEERTYSCEHIQMRREKEGRAVTIPEGKRESDKKREPTFFIYFGLKWVDLVQTNTADRKAEAKRCRVLQAREKKESSLSTRYITMQREQWLTGMFGRVSRDKACKSASSPLQTGFDVRDHFSVMHKVGGPPESLSTPVSPHAKLNICIFACR